MCFRNLLWKKNIENIFTDIYYNRKWKGGNPETRSGIGSTLKHTGNLRSELSKLLIELKIKSMLDIPCGDFNWMKETDLSMLDKYIGADIVKSLIENNKRQYQNNIIKFKKIDITCDALPDVEIILCRDIMIHLSFEDIHKALRNIGNSKARYVLINNFPSIKENKDIDTVRHRYVNFLIHPFELPKPILTLEEVSFKEGTPKVLGLWEVNSLNRNLN